MGDLTINAMTAELQRRVEQLDVAMAEAAIVRALRYMHGCGSWTFDFTGVISGAAIVGIHPGDDATVGEFTLPADCDTGKAMFIANGNGLPIFKHGVTHLWETFAMGIPVGEAYGTYEISGRKLLLRPGTAQTIGVRYHILFATPAGNTFTRLPPLLDELAIDLAEAKERQIYSVGDVWFKQLEITMGLITKALDGYSSISMQQMPLLEAAQAAHEATQLGRA